MKGKPGETQFVGQELLVNPPPKAVLERKEARLKTIHQMLKGNLELSGTRKSHFEKAARRLMLEIQIIKGEY